MTAVTATTAAKASGYGHASNLLQTLYGQRLAAREGSKREAMLTARINAHRAHAHGHIQNTEEQA